MKKKAYIFTLGCKINIYESEVIKSILSENGYSFTRIPDESDIIIVNSCTVTAKADSKMYKFLNKVSRSNPKALKIVTGCYTQLAYKELNEQHLADIILGVNNKYNVIDAIDKYRSKGKFVDTPDQTNTEFADYHLGEYKNYTRAFLKIQDGCDNFCTYCTIAKARGNSRSKSVSSVINDINMLVKNGYREIILSGIDLGSYCSSEGDKDYKLKNIIKEILKIEGFRLRISSVEPWCFDDELIKTLTTNDRICKHFHIPLQSGSDIILKKMNRKYRIKEFDHLINRLKVSDQVLIATDIIAGFPTESEKEYFETRDYFERSKIDTAHIFSYSDRPYAAANHLYPKVEKSIIESRGSELRKISENKFNEFCIKNSGIEKEIIVESIKRSGEGFIYTGVTENYLQRELHSLNKYNKGDLVKVKV